MLKHSSKESEFFTGTQFQLIFIMIFYEDAAREERAVTARGYRGSASDAIFFYLAKLSLYILCIM